FISSDNISLAGYLRSQLGGRYDVVIMRLPAGHTNILTRPTKRIDLRSLVAVVRRSELMKKGAHKPMSFHVLAKEGRLAEVPEWYYDTATNSILNGGTNAAGVPPTGLSKAEFIKLAEVGLSEELWNPHK